MSTPVQDKVACGVALLDEVYPGWDQKINLARLDIRDCGRCVLAQLYGDYDTGLDRPRLSSVVPSSHSFAGAHEVTVEWRRVILERRAYPPVYDSLVRLALRFFAVRS